MNTPYEKRRSLEGSSAVQRKETLNILPGMDIPSFAPERASKAAFQEVERLFIELLTTMSHEFRTPLTVINGYTSTLLRQKQQLSLEEQVEFLKMIQQAGNRLEFLMDRLLEIAELEAGAVHIENDMVDIPSLARETISSAERFIPDPFRDRFTFHLYCQDASGDLAQEATYVRGDIHCLRRVLEQLLENAIRFSPDGGSIDVIVRPVPQEPEVSTHDQPRTSAAFLEICVCDDGQGIPDEDLERIFERFYRVDTRLTREVNGLGLGLTVCKYLVTLHKGRIWAESGPEGGSAFHIWLPQFHV